MDDLSNKQVLITGICWLEQFFGVWEIADRGLGLLLLWPLSLAVGKDLVDWELLGGRVASSTLLLFYGANTTWIWQKRRLQQLHMVYLATIGISIGASAGTGICWPFLP